MHQQRNATPCATPLPHGFIQVPEIGMVLNVKALDDVLSLQKETFRKSHGTDAFNKLSNFCCEHLQSGEVVTVTAIARSAARNDRGEYLYFCSCPYRGGQERFTLCGSFLTEHRHSQAKRQPIVQLHGVPARLVSA